MGHQASSHATPLGHHAVQVAQLLGGWVAVGDATNWANHPLSGALQESVSGVIDFHMNEQKTPEFLSLNPNGKIPAIIDRDGPSGTPLGTFRIRHDPAPSLLSDTLRPASGSIPLLPRTNGGAAADKAPTS